VRNTLFILILLNFLAFIYQAWIIEPEEPVSALYFAQDYPGLVVAEVKVRPGPPAVQDAPEPVDAQELKCMRIGPFAREVDADSVGAALEASDAEVSRNSEMGQVWVGHWVQVTGQASRLMAEQTRDKLKAAGMRDAYVLAGDDHRISLGVFRLRSSANGVVQQATQLGLPTRVDDRFQPGANFWLQVRMPDDLTPQLGELQATPGQILRTETILCADSGF
jgi:hypothetical protein